MRISNQEWKRIIEDQEKSGLSIKKYCEIHGLGYSTFHKRKGEQSSAPVFQKVIVETEPTTTSDSWIEFVCAGFHMKVMRKDLHEVLRAVQRL